MIITRILYTKPIHECTCIIVRGISTPQAHIGYMNEGRSYNTRVAQRKAEPGDIGLMCLSVSPPR